MNHSALTNILPDWPAWADRQPHLVRRLAGGLTNDNYLLQVQDRHYVLRINAANSDALDLGRASERAALARAGAAGIGAWLVHSDPAGRYQVTEYIAGRQWQPQDWCIDGGVERIAGLLQTIHGLAPVTRMLNVSA